MMPIVAVCMPWIGSGTALLSQTVHERLRRICSPRHAFAGIVLLVVAVMLPRALRPLHEASMPLVDFARRLGEQAAPADTLLANSSYVPFYSGLEGRVIEAVQSIDEMRDAQGRLPYRWVVLEMGSSNFNAQWPSQLASEYHQVANDHLYKGSKKVLFFETN